MSQSKWKGILSLISSICSLGFAFIPVFGIFVAGFAIGLGIWQNKKEKSGIATAGIVIGSIGLVIAIIMTIVVFSIGAAVSSVHSENTKKELLAKTGNFTVNDCTSLCGFVSNTEMMTTSCESSCYMLKKPGPYLDANCLNMISILK
jgi:hypothetical protein